MNLGNNIIRLRKEKGLSQSQLAKKSGLTKRQIGYFEKEFSESLFTNLEAIAKALDVTIVDLIAPNKTTDIQKTFENIDARTVRKIKEILSLPKRELHIVYAIVDGLLAKIEIEKNKK